jgi:type I restriction enzyme S subunit
LDKIYIRYPESKEEQTLIVAEIEKQFTRLDEAVKSLKSVKQKLEVYRKAVEKGF